MLIASFDLLKGHQVTCYWTQAVIVTNITIVNFQAKESVTSEGPATSVLEALKDIINEAKLIKTALSSSLPISWSGEVNTGSGRETLHDSSDVLGDSNLGKIDFVSAAGFEMVELLIFVAELLLKDHTAESGSWYETDWILNHLALDSGMLMMLLSISMLCRLMDE